MLCQCGSIAQDDQFHTGTGDGYIHATQVIQKSDVALVVGTHETDHDNITLLSLKAVYGMDGNEFTERLKERVAFDQSSDILNLRFIRRDQSEVDAFVQHPLFGDLFDIGLQLFYQ